jgi:hypothetical protein
MPALTEPNTPLKREDLGDELTIVDHKTCPFSSMVAKKGAPNDSIFYYPVDDYASPKTGGRADGTDVTGGELTNGTENMKKLGACIQWFHRAVGIGKIAQTVPNVAGVGKGKLLSRAISKKLVELKRDHEYQFLSSRESVQDNGTVGYETRGVGRWIQTAAQSHLPVDAAYRSQAGAVVSVAAITDFSEAHLNDLLEAQFGVTGSKDLIHAFVTTALKRVVTNFRNIVSNAAGTTVLRRYNDDLKATTLKNVVDVYEGDFGRVVFTPVLFLDPTAVTGNAPKQHGYFLHMDRWHTRNQQNPGAEDLPNGGGGPKKQIDAICALACDNPKGEGKVQLT